MANDKEFLKEYTKTSGEIAISLGDITIEHRNQILNLQAICLLINEKDGMINFFSKTLVEILDLAKDFNITKEEIQNKSNSLGIGNFMPSNIPNFFVFAKKLGYISKDRDQFILQLQSIARSLLIYEKNDKLSTVIKGTDGDIARSYIGKKGPDGQYLDKDETVAMQSLEHISLLLNSLPKTQEVEQQRLEIQQKLDFIAIFMLEKIIQDNNLKKDDFRIDSLKTTIPYNKLGINIGSFDIKESVISLIQKMQLHSNSLDTSDFLFISELLLPLRSEQLNLVTSNLKSFQVKISI